MKKIMINIFGPAIILMAAGTLLSAAPPVMIQEGGGKYVLDQNIDILVDPTGTLTLHDITRPETATRFAANRKAPQFGFTNSVYWARFTVKNNSSEDMFYLEHQYAPMDEIRLFVSDEEGTYRESRSGDTVPLESHRVKYRNAVFPLRLDRTEPTICYIRFQSTSSMNLSLVLWKQNGFTEDSNTKEIFFGLFYGIMFVMMAYNLLIYLSVRDVSYLYYIFYTLGASLFYATLNGHAFRYLWSNIWWANICLPLFITSSCVLAIQFNRTFLDTKRFLPRLDIVLKIFAGINIAAVLTAPLVKYSIAIQVATLMTIILPCLLLACGIIVLVNGNRAARFYVLAWSMFFVGTVVQSLRAFAVVKDNFFTIWSQMIGAVFEVTLLSLALADRINMMKKEREESQNEIIRMQKNYSESLERTVKERTAELEIERNKLHQKNIMMEHEIALARKIQIKLIPEGSPSPFIACVYKPMEALGGDFYDFIKISESGKIGIFLSDVSGHGVPAAFITSMIKTILLQAGRRTNNPEELLYYMNSVLQSQTAGNFVTAFYGIYDPADHSLLYANAGHNQPYIITDDSVTQLQGGRNTAIAMFTNNTLARSSKKYENKRELLPVGAKLLLYTDGLTEARPVDADNYFEYTGMEEIFISNHGLGCAPFLAKLMDELTAFRKAEEFNDDICIICVDIVSPSRMRL